MRRLSYWLHWAQKETSLRLGTAQERSVLENSAQAVEPAVCGQSRQLVRAVVRHLLLTLLKLLEAAQMSLQVEAWLSWTACSNHGVLSCLHMRVRLPWLDTTSLCMPLRDAECKL